TIDGARVFLITVGGEADLAASRENSNLASETIEARLRVRVPVKAGERAIGVAFLQTPPTQDTQPLQPYLRSSADTLAATGRPHIEPRTTPGPFTPPGSGDTRSRRRIFVCRPASQTAETPCARQVITTIARRAYRQPLTDLDVQRLMKFYEDGRRKG